MAVFRIEKTRDYTVMANHHLRNTALSLKAKGLLSLMLSLPEDWDYTTKGHARICKDGVDSICSTVKELEDNGYIIRERIRNDKGQLTTVEYIIMEQPKPPSPEQEKPERENPVLDNPVLGKPEQVSPKQGNPAQLNTKKSSNQKSNKDLSSTDTSNPIQSNPFEPQAADGMGTDKREAYRELILENIEYDIIVQDKRLDRDRLDEIVDLLTDTVCSARDVIRIAGDDFPAEVVKSRLLKLDSSHIQYVLDCMAEYTAMLRGQLARGNNGLVKTKFLTLTIEAGNTQAARGRLARIEADTLNHFKVMGAAGEVNTNCPVCRTDMTNCMGKEAAPEPEPEPEKSGGMGGVLVIVLILALGGGGAYYYFKVMKPKQSVKGGSDLDDFDFEDDEDEETEFEVYEDEQEDMSE